MKQKKHRLLFPLKVSDWSAGNGVSIHFPILPMEFPIVLLVGVMRTMLMLGDRNVPSANHHHGEAMIYKKII